MWTTILLYTVAFMIFPIVGGLFFRYYLHYSYTWKEFAANVAIVLIAVTTVLSIGLFGKTTDTELLNGEITGKQRVHDTYQESYQCNCRTVCTGSGDSRSCSTVCDTCWRTIYTVEWFATSTVGKILFARRESQSRSVYLAADPKAYTDCVIGEPASVASSFTNYVKATPSSLFHSNDQSNHPIPAYPGVHSFYKVNRVISVGNVGNRQTIIDLNGALNDALKSLGKKKQVNIIVVVTRINDPTYKFAVENAWLGGKKNDVVVFLGVNGDDITWADAMTWAKNAGNELFVVKLRDRLIAAGKFESNTIADAITSTITTDFTRPKMADYEYLIDDIEISTWSLLVALLLSIGLSLGLTFIFHKYVR